MTNGLKTCVGACLASLLLSAAAHAATPVAGAINANGTAQQPSSRYSVAHPSVGRYVITFTPAFAPFPTCLFTPITATRVAGLGENANTCDVTFVSLTTNAVTDTLFTFIAITTSH